VLSLNDGQLMLVFGRSNIYAFEHDKYLKVPDGVLAEQGLGADDVIAVSDSWEGLLVVCRTGVGRGSQRGIFNKRVEVAPFIPYDSVTELVREQRQPHGRESWIKLRAGAQTVGEFVWHSGGDVEIADAARERDRIYEAISEALGAIA